MRKIILTGIVLIGLTACHNYKKDAQQLTALRDSLQQEAAWKDSSIVEFLSEFNEIQASLDSVKKLENLVTVQSSQGNELSASQKDRILEDIALLNGLLQKNKEQMAALQKKLNSANAKAGKLEGTIRELQLMIGRLETQIMEKDSEITELNNQVQKLNLDITTLNERIAEVETESRQKTATIEDQTVRMNTVYYVFGSEKELKDNGIIENKGGLIGIGRTSVVKKDFNRDYFTETDIRTFQYLPLMMKKARIVSVHPAGSFHISGEKSADTLFIDNQEEFWKASKYLVIITN